MTHQIHDLVMDNQIQAIFGANAQVPNEMAVGISMTAYGERALCEATLQILGAAWGEAGAASVGEAVVSLDSVDPCRLGPEFAATAACEALKGEPSSFAEIAEEFRVLMDAAADATSQRGRAGRDWASGEIRRRLDRLVSAVGQVAAGRPQDVPETVRRLQRQAETFVETALDASSLARLTSLLASARDLAKFRRELPPPAFLSAERRLLGAALEQFAKVRAGILNSLAAKLVAQLLPDALDRLGTIAMRSEAVLEHLAEARVRLEELDKELRQSARDRSSGPTVQLPEPGGNLLIRAIRRRKGWKANELMQQVLDRFRQRVIGHIAESADLALDADEAARRLYELLPKVPSHALAQMAIESMRSLQGDAGGMRFWDAVKSYGPEQLADELFHKAAPTLSAGGRDVPDFGLASRQFLFVHLPHAANGQEASVRQRLQDRLGSRVAFTRVNDALERQDVVIIRYLVGIPTSLWTDNKNLLRSYGQAHDLERHPPHLVDLLPDAPDGEASPAHLVLAGVLDLDDLAALATVTLHDDTHSVAAATFDPVAEKETTPEETDDADARS